MSPWLYQLMHKRPIDTLSGDMKTEVAIVGAGIAGVMTAYYILKYTDKQVLMIDGSKVAHGATGHNAGQLIAEFERELHDIAREFGVEEAISAEKAVNHAWVLLEEVFSEASLTTPYSTFMGYNGYQSIGRLMDELKNNALRREAGEPIHNIFIADTAEGLDEIPHAFKDLYNVIPHEHILDLLETNNKDYIAALSIRKGCINGAMLCEEIVGYLLGTYAGRFILVEHAPIKEVVLEEEYAILRGVEHQIECDKVILCTNGFSKFRIINNAGNDIDTLFHHQIHGFVGYMAGYIEALNQQPNALAYYAERSRKSRHRKTEEEYYDDPYFYLTRRPYEVEKNETHNLVCLGGPEIYLADTSSYDPHGVYDKLMAEQMDRFLKSTYRHTPKDGLQFKFTWHGLMGYTSNGIRLIGPEPLNPVLMYNLGCNGVGIMPSIYGGHRIAQILAGEEVVPMIFDPKRCDGGLC